MAKWLGKGLGLGLGAGNELAFFFFFELFLLGGGGGGVRLGGGGGGGVKDQDCKGFYRLPKSQFLPLLPPVQYLSHH